MQKTALITGITGQDGAYLAKYLLENNYKVIGGKRRTSNTNLWRLNELNITDDIEYVELDLTDSSSIYSVIKEYQPDEVYNLAAQSFVGTSFGQPEFTANVNALGVTRILDSIYRCNKEIKFYQASTSEMYGGVGTEKQNENTPFYPKSPYGVSKLYGHWITINYRESYDLFACSGILFNHESPLRGEEFVTRKVIKGLVKIKHGLEDVLEIGNLNARRDWGYAADYVRGMHLMLQHDTPGDYVLATGNTYSIKDLIEITLAKLNIDGHFEPETSNNNLICFIDTKTNKKIIKTNPKFYRPAEVNLLHGNPEKAEKILGWKPAVNFEKLVEIMVEAELKRLTLNSSSYINKNYITNANDTAFQKI